MNLLENKPFGIALALFGAIVVVIGFTEVSFPTSTLVNFVGGCAIGAGIAIAWD